MGVGLSPHPLVIDVHSQNHAKFRGVTVYEERSTTHQAPLLDITRSLRNIPYYMKNSRCQGVSPREARACPCIGIIAYGRLPHREDRDTYTDKVSRLSIIFF